MQFNKKIDYLMKINNINSLRKLAEQANIPYTTLWDYYSSDQRLQNAKISNISKIAKTLNCTMDYLAYDDITEPNETKISEKIIYQDKDNEVSVLIHPDIDKFPDEVKADILRQAMEEKQNLILEETEQLFNIKKELDNIEKKD